MPSRLPHRLATAALVAVASIAMLATSFEADARRLGGGSSVGRQSGNVTMQRQATPSSPAASPSGASSVPPSASSSAAARTPAAAAPAAAGAGAATAARTGASRWLGPIAGIAAGLGIAALLSHLGLSGAFAELLSSMLLIALVVFAIMFVVRRLRGAAPRPAMQGAYGAARTGMDAPATPDTAPWRQTALEHGAAASTSVPALASATPAVAAVQADGEGDWSVPQGFDTQNFLAEAKKQFVHIQAIWDSGDTARLHEYLTDDLIVELKPQLAQREGASNKTEVVLLNAELLGIEAVSDGHLASVRFAGMLREAPDTEAFRFEEVWNLFKPSGGGWLLAGIQQIPVEYAS
jgi:predicted lipid-binding transport protein (Tim44 family)